MKTILALTLVSLLSGCTARIDGWQLEKSNELCKDKGGIDYIDYYTYALVRCLDGTSQQVGENQN